MIEFGNPSQSLFDTQSQSDQVRDEEPRPGMTAD